MSSKASLLCKSKHSINLFFCPKGKTNKKKEIKDGKANFLQYLNNFSILNGIQMQTRLLDILSCFTCTLLLLRTRKFSLFFIVRCFFAQSSSRFWLWPLHFYLDFTCSFLNCWVCFKLTILKMEPNWTFFENSQVSPQINEI